MENNDQNLKTDSVNPTQENLTNPQPQKSNTKMLLIGLGVLFIVILISAGMMLYFKNKNQTATNVDSPIATQNEKAPIDFGQQIKSAHFETSTPEHGTTLAAAPNQIAINFNFDLAKPSDISITSGGKKYSTGDTVIDENLLTMRLGMDTDAPDGLYEVKYHACWPDSSCHDGVFTFAIDRTKASSYTDLTGKKEVTIKMKEIKFDPQNIIIDKGTKVTWVNNEDVVHYVNTDSHPGHTHQLGFNSKALNKGVTYSYTFDQAGAYPYHCSAHASQMTANIVVI